MLEVDVCLVKALGHGLEAAVEESVRDATAARPEVHPVLVVVVQNVQHWLSWPRVLRVNRDAQRLTFDQTGPHRSRGWVTNHATLH